MAECEEQGVADGQRGLRIASIFVILVASLLGAMTPVLLARQSKMHVPKFTFFICKYFGTGVIIATAWMHLLDPAIDAFSDECVADRLPEYPWALAIGLMTLMVMFLIEIIVTKFNVDPEHDHNSGADSDTDPSMDVLGQKKPRNTDSDGYNTPEDIENGQRTTIPGRQDDVSYPPGGTDHLAHRKDHKDDEGIAAQLLGIFILEFGVVFHSVFVGLTLGTTEDLTVLFIVLVFHQMFEGLGLGSRLATAPWPKTKRWVPYALALGFAVSTPVGIAAGIGARPSKASDQTLVNGIFDSISAGILMYTGLVELLAHEFMFNPHMRRASLKIQLFAFLCIALGAGLMSLLAKWA